MATTWTDSELQELYNEVARRSAVDPEFRALALTDPTAAIAKITDRPLPGDKVIQFVDNSKVLHIPLPDPVSELSEISDFELEQVAGGDIGVSWNR